MRADFAKSPLGLSICGTRGDGTAGLENFKSETTGAVVLRCDALEDFDAFCVLAFADEKFGSFFETNDKDARHGHDEDEGAGGVPHVAPALVVGFGAGRCVRKVGGIQTAVVGEEAPGEESCYQLTDTWEILV